MAFKELQKDEIDKAADTLSDDEEMEVSLIEYIEELVEGCSTYEEAEEKLLEAYSHIEYAKLQESVKKAIANSILYGSFKAGNDR